jgi:NAD(P)-dependent dehydrogenase (short-subunit alcohol dehydrogenase family)
VIVASLTVAAPFSLGFVVVRFDRTAAPISSGATESVRPISFHTLPEHEPNVGDVVLLNGQREHRRALFRVNAAAAEGLWRCMKYELAQMVQQGAGAIINVSSVAGLRAAPGLAAYNASKHGVVGLTKRTGIEYASQGIRVNAICPGWVETPMTAEYGSDPERRRQMVASEPIGRTAQPEEVADATVWLYSDGATYITGDAIAVDGGQTA